MGAAEQREEQREDRLARVPENLRAHAFKPGQSGNPAGRPKGRVSLSARIEKELLRQAREDVLVADLLAHAIVKACVEDPIRARQLILAIQDRDEGPVAKDGPLVEFSFGQKLPQPPDVEPGEDGAPAFGDHLSRLLAIAVERGNVDLQKVLGALPRPGEGQIIDQED